MLVMNLLEYSRNLKWIKSYLATRWSNINNRAGYPNWGYIIRISRDFEEIYMNSLHEVKAYDLSFQLSTIYLESAFRILRYW